MKTVKIFWAGTSQSGKFWLGVEITIGKFIVHKFVQTTELLKVKAGDSIKVPTACLQ